MSTLKLPFEPLERCKELRLKLQFTRKVMRKLFFKSEDDKRKAEAQQRGRVCGRCGGTGTLGVGGRGAWGSTPCPDCGGSGQK